MIRLKIVAGLRTIAHQGQTLSEGVKGISITITNIGSRTVRITNLHWRIGRLRKTFLHQITDVNPYTSPLPLKLADGEEAHYFLPVDAWEETNADKPFYIGKFPSISAQSLRIMVSTSVGKSFKSKVEEELRQWFLDRGRFQKAR